MLNKTELNATIEALIGTRNPMLSFLDLFHVTNLDWFGPFGDLFLFLNFITKRQSWVIPITMISTSLNAVRIPPRGLLGPLYPEQVETKLDKFVKIKMKFSAQN